MVLALAETDFLRIVDDGNGVLDAWVAKKGTPASWRERGDIEWWASLLARRHEPELRVLRSARSDLIRNEAESDEYYRRLANGHLEMMAYQLGYPLDTIIGGCPFWIYRDVLGQLIAWALRARDRGEVIAPRSERSLLAALAAALAVDSALIGRAAAFTLDGENAAYHAAVPGIAAAPLVRGAPDRLVWLLHGLTTQPLLFMLRELRRCDSQDYHNTAYLREAVFRQDLYALFQDKRFVPSSGRIELRRSDGGIRTAIDAVIFELKSQDPFARSTAELARRRDNVLYANRQVSAMLNWLKRYGADEILNRVDHRTAKTFRVQRVLPFVLARFLAHFGDGPEPGRRAAWGTWPQLLRHVDGLPSAANPLGSLFTRLTSESRTIPETASGPPREIAIGNMRLIVHPSYAAYQAHSSSGRLARP